MVSIPVRLHKAARHERVRFHHVYRPAEVEEEPEPEPPASEAPPAKGRVHEFPKPTAVVEQPPPDSVMRVRNVPVAETAEARVERPPVLKGYEIEKGRYVTFEPEEIKALRPQTSSELDIAEFVRLAEIDPIFFDASYYIAPDQGGEKAYVLLFRALAESGYAAVGAFTMHGREHPSVIRCGRTGLILHTLFNAKEVHAEQEFRGDPSLANPKELELAKRFIAALAAPFDADKLKDTFEERLRQLIEERVDTAVAEYHPGEEAPRAPVADIMEALRKSLEMVRKPPKTEQAPKPPRARPARVRGGRSRT